jgi:spore maturation protein SpmB
MPNIPHTKTLLLLCGNVFKIYGNVDVYSEVLVVATEYIGYRSEAILVSNLSFFSESSPRKFKRKPYF